MWRQCSHHPQHSKQARPKEVPLPPSPQSMPETRLKNRALGGKPTLMNSQITAESAAASTWKGRVAPGAPFPGMSVRDSRNGKPDKQVPDPDASSARSTLLAPSSLGMWPVGRETAARRGVCDGPQGPENPPPALADGREGTRLARLSASPQKALGRASRTRGGEPATRCWRQAWS